MKRSQSHSLSHTTAPAWWAIPAAPAQCNTAVCVPTAGAVLGCCCFVMLMLLTWQLMVAVAVTRLKAPCSLSHWPLTWSLRVEVSLSSWLAHDLCHGCQRSWKSTNLAILTALWKWLCSREDPCGGKFPRYRTGGSDVDDHSLTIHNQLIQKHFLSFSFPFLLRLFFLCATY